MENSEFELKTDGIYKVTHIIKSGNERLNVLVELFKSDYSLDRLKIIINPINETIQQQKYNITFRTNYDLLWIFRDINQQSAFLIYVNLLKHKLRNPSKIFCRIDVINTQQQLPPLDQPEQSNEHESQIKNALHELLTCSVCFDFMKVRNIYFCERGHSVICEECFHKLNPRKCPECRAQMCTKRNYSLEKTRDVLFGNESNYSNIPTYEYNRDRANIDNNIPYIHIPQYTNENFHIDITNNLGNIIIKGIKKLFEWFANDNNWNRNERKEFLTVVFIILEVYVLFAVVCFTLITFDIKLKGDSTFSYIIMIPLLIVLVLNLSSSINMYQYFFNANANADENTLFNISKNIGYILIERIIKKSFESVARDRNWNQTDRRNFLTLFFLIFEVFVLHAVVECTLVIFCNYYFTPFNLLRNILPVVIALNISPPTSVHHIFFGPQRQNNPIRQ